MEPSKVIPTRTLQLLYIDIKINASGGMINTNTSKHSKKCGGSMDSPSVNEVQTS